jgi:hypothetical protein
MLFHSKARPLTVLDFTKYGTENIIPPPITHMATTPICLLAFIIFVYCGNPTSRKLLGAQLNWNWPLLLIVDASPSSSPSMKLLL